MAHLSNQLLFLCLRSKEAETTRHRAFANTAASRLFKGIFSWLLHSSLHPTSLVTVLPMRKWEKRIQDKGKNIRSTLWLSFSEKYNGLVLFLMDAGTEWSQMVWLLCSDLPVFLFSVGMKSYCYPPPPTTAWLRQTCIVLATQQAPFPTLGVSRRTLVKFHLHKLWMP